MNRLLVSSLILLVSCTAPPRQPDFPVLESVSLETRTEGTLELHQVRLFALRSGVEEALRVLPAPTRPEGGIPWENLRSVVVPPEAEWTEGEEPGDSRAPLQVQTRGTGRTHVFVVDASEGRRRLLVRGQDAHGLVISIDLLDCVSLSVLQP